MDPRIKLLNSLADTVPPEYYRGEDLRFYAYAWFHGQTCIYVASTAATWYSSKTRITTRARRTPTSKGTTLNWSRSLLIRSSQKQRPSRSSTS